MAQASLVRCQREKCNTSCDADNLPPRHIPANEIGGPKSVKETGLIPCLSLAMRKALTAEAEKRDQSKQADGVHVLPTCTSIVVLSQSAWNDRNTLPARALSELPRHPFLHKLSRRAITASIIRSTPEHPHIPVYKFARPSTVPPVNK